MAKIIHVHAREVLDSRGRPTVEVEVACDDGASGRAIVPSGASTGRAEACELRDGDPQRYDGLGVLAAVRNVNEILAPALAARDPADQFAIDEQLCELDGTPQKTNLGANALLGVSLACAHAAADAAEVPLFVHLHALIKSRAAAAGDDEASISPPKMPVPMTNMISGGLHAGGQIEFQDFLIVPHGAADYPTALEWTVRIYRRTGELLSREGYDGRLVGDEGGFGPRLESNAAAAEFVVRAIEAAGLRPGEDVSLALDVASSHFYDDGRYTLAATGEARLSSEEMIDQLAQLVDTFPICSIEDGLAEEDWDGWRSLTQRLGHRIHVVGDDLFVTNPQRVRRGIDQKAGNAVLVKVNQIGTLTETLDTLRLAKRGEIARVVSARSGETEDTTIADLAVAAAAESIKIGSIVRSERLAKYNRLLRLAEVVQDVAVFCR